jgi:hypothetical protein
MAITSIGKRCLYCEEDGKIKKWSAYAWLALARWTRWVYMSKRVHDHRSDSVEDLLPATPGISTLMIQKNLILCRYRMAVYVISQRGILASTAILKQYVGRNVDVDAVVRKINPRAD